jgi:hypothetical protein
MKSKASITLFLLLLVTFALGFMLGRETQPRTVTAPTKPAKKQNQTRYVVYYFFSGKRCTTCRNIENYTRQTVVKDYAESLAEQRMTFYPVNVDDAKNKHFIDQYKLTNKTVVIAEYKDGKCVKFKHLKKVWELTHNKKLFDQYIRNEITAFSGLKK